MMLNLTIIESIRRRTNGLLTVRLWRWYSTKSTNTKRTEKVSVGDVSIAVNLPSNPELVPAKYVSKVMTQSVLKHLRWMMQKDLLGQDIYMIGPPGPLRRTIALQYLEMTKKEAEYLSLSRDTTESDLKQRREIQSGTAHYIDQCAVRAAIHGRILILDGIEKAERNVLPILNNLLENREMQLEDGRFLIPAHRYDKLLQEYGKEEMEAWNLARVSENFRVIALGLPVPLYQGNPLDPPLRSRFQARVISPIAFKDYLTVLADIGPSIPKEKISKLLSFAYTIISKESTSLHLPDFPVNHFIHLIKILERNPGQSAFSLLQYAYPYKLILNKEGQTAVEDTAKTFTLMKSNAGESSLKNISKEAEKHTALINLHSNYKEFEVQVPAGDISSIDKSEDFVMTKYHNSFLAKMFQLHSVADFCIVGSKGCGKSAVVERFAESLGYNVEPIMLYQDMTARDLLQQRTTLPNGDTVWRMSPLIVAAIQGKIAVLDGLHRISTGTLAVIQRLVQDRELQLYSGERLYGDERYEYIKSQNNFTDEEMKNKGILKIHPSFRIIGLAEPPVVGNSKQQWLNPELLTMFLFLHMRPLTMAEEQEVIGKMIVEVNNKIEPVLQLAHFLRTSEDSTLQNFASSLSTRQLLRIANRLQKYPEEDCFATIQKACLARFLPPLAKMSLVKAMSDFGIEESKPLNESVTSLDCSITSEVKNGFLRIGKTSAPLYQSSTKTKVPDVLFYDSVQHLSVMEDMLKDYLLGQHLLLIGNQGVGKNKIVDRFLFLLNRPREYIQLHRDTTVQTLTMQPTIKDGVIVYEDSPLVRAVKLGHILVIDEADKAPTHVTCILKTLVESGVMMLADGRRIVPALHQFSCSNDNNSDVIFTHPDFRMMVLANRPGFPFLGNDFFGALGDIFSVHAVDNPDTESEVSMLSKYGPHVPKHILHKLVTAFGELRSMADQGLIAYPYSTREVVNIVKHLEVFPDEGLVTVVKNVFDFDSFTEEVQDVIIDTLQKHGIPMGAKSTNVHFAPEFPLPKPILSTQWKFQLRIIDPETERPSVSVEKKEIKLKKPSFLNSENLSLDLSDARSLAFTEQVACYSLPKMDYNVVLDVAVTKSTTQMNDQIHVVTGNPIYLFTANLKERKLLCHDFLNLFPNTRGGYRPHLQVAPLGGALEGQLILHEETTNWLYLIDPVCGTAQQIYTSTLFSKASDIAKRIQGKPKGFHRMCKEFADNNLIVIYQRNGNQLELLNLEKGSSFLLNLNLDIQSVHSVDFSKWILTDCNERKYLLQKLDPDNDDFYSLFAIEETPPGVLNIKAVSQTGVESFALNEDKKDKITAPNRLMHSDDAFVNIVVGFPDLLTTNDVYSFKRNKTFSEQTERRHHNPIAFLPTINQIVSVVPLSKAPEEIVPVDPSRASGVLEIVDLPSFKVRYIPIQMSENVSPYSAWLNSISETNLLLTTTSSEGVVTVDAGGTVRLWETSFTNLEKSLMQWKRLLGDSDDRPLQLNIETSEVGDLSSPKHGKEDPENAPHFGGNTWAGGTGGRDTAGLGGIGGPYRLDAGHAVHQVSQVAKDAVPEEVKRAAREMARKAYKERLKAIEMSEFDAELYEKFFKGVKKQVQLLRVILDSLQAKSKERTWLHHQTSGEFDDMKLIEGLTGEKAIYKRRGEREPEMGSIQEKPKYLKLLVDVSGSMYRFDGHDGRLQRVMEAALLVMEAFENYGDKFQYEIIGHSGDDYNLEFVKSPKEPTNNKERLDVLKMMHAHAQFCSSGDNTLEATQFAIETITKQEADEYFVIVLSDANFDRYGIRPESLSRILMSNSDVNSFAIFIGSLGNQAQRLSRALPSGKGFVCLDLKLIPHIMQQIFTSSLLAR